MSVKAVCSPKRRPSGSPKDSIEPPTKTCKLDSPNSLEPDKVDEETCPICLDSSGNSDEHRLVALKCGHRFGSQCVKRWLKAHPVRVRSCPTCMRRANIKDLRFVYARTVLTTDTSQVTRKELQKINKILVAELKVLHTQADTSQKKIATMEAELVVLHSQADTSQKKIATMEVELVVLHCQADTSQKKIATMEAELVVLHSQADTSQKKIETLEAELVVLHSQADKSQKKIEKLSK